MGFDKSGGSLLPVIAPAPKVKQQKDRRAGPRVPVELDFEEHEPGARYFRLTWDLSVFGLSTRGSGATHPVGSRLDLRLHLPDRRRTEPVQLEAEVVGYHADSDGLRLAFRNAPVDAIRRISRYLARRQPVDRRVD